MKRTAQLILTTGAIAIAPFVHGQAPDTSEWVCEYCPFEQGHRGDYEVGATSVSDDSAYFGNATGYDEDGVYGNVDGTGSYASDDFRLSWLVEDLALDSRVVDLAGGRPGSFDFNIGYRELPRRQFNTTETVFTAAGSDTLLLPSGWLHAGLTGGMTELAANLSPHNIESDRSVFDLGAAFTVADRWRISAEYRRQEIDGNRISGGSSFIQASLLPMPFDHAMDQVDLGIRYNADNGFVALGWYLSEFENENSALTWQHPFTFDPALGNDTFALATPPDNRFQQLSLKGAYAFGRRATTISVSAATGEAEQNASFLPYTITNGIPVVSLPRPSLDGKIDTSNFALALASRPIDRLRLKVSYRYDERDNRTAQDLWNRVIVDTFPTADLEMNIPYSFERSTFSASADYDLFETVRVSAGYDHRTIDRSFQEVEEQTVDEGWGRLRWQPTPALEMDIRGGASERDYDNYDEALASALGQNPLMRKYNLAYRYRNFGDISLSFFSADVSVTLNAMVAEDEYNQSPMGITGGEELHVTADVDWSISENSSVYLTAGFEDIEAEQSNSGIFATPDWQAMHDDDFTTVGAGFRIDNIGEKVDLSLDYMRSDGESEITVDSTTGVLSEFPELETELEYLRLRLDYRFSERLELNLNLRYQRFETEDWALEGVTPDAIPLVLSLGAEPFDDDVFMVGIGFRYRVGAD